MRKDATMIPGRDGTPQRTLVYEVEIAPAAGENFDIHVKFVNFEDRKTFKLHARVGHADAVPAAIASLIEKGLQDVPEAA